MKQTLLRRLEYLEAQITPPRNPHVIKIEYVDATGAAVGDSSIIECSLARDRRRLGRNRGYIASVPARPTRVKMSAPRLRRLMESIETPVCPRLQQSSGAAPQRGKMSAGHRR
jgi:hypothetical protein